MNKNSFNFLDRIDSLNKNQTQLFDLIVIGGGITGAGILLDASSRGLNTLLLEKKDFASGTSGRSTKLIHGGLRYLKEFEFSLVRKVGKERAIVFNNAPHLIVPQKLLLPIYKNGTFKKWQLSIALKLYDWLAGVKKNERKKIFNFNKTILKEPTLNKEGLVGAGFYSEYRTDDARLTLEIIKTAINFNAEAYNYLEVRTIKKSNNIFHVKAYDTVNNISFEFKSKQLVNASGPWTDDIRKKNNSISKEKICLSKGVHIVLKHENLPIKNPVYFDTLDKRMCFAIPRNNCTYVGTTDTLYEKSEKKEPTPNIKDITYILDSVNNCFDVPKLKLNNVISSWTGLRPLILEEGKKTSEISRKDELIIAQNKMISIAGGKLTGYRLMAKKVVDLIVNNLDRSEKCYTSEIKISGSKNINQENVNEVKTRLSEKLAEIEIHSNELDYLFHNYGSQLTKIITLLKTNRYNTIVEAEAHFCIMEENLYYPLDFFLRRTSKLYYSPEKIEEEIILVTPIFSKLLNLNSDEIKLLINQLLAYKKRLTTFTDD
jgi:glycerol-3-phosphate dehydrogenase